MFKHIMINRQHEISDRTVDFFAHFSVNPNESQFDIRKCKQCELLFPF